MKTIRIATITALIASFVLVAMIGAGCHMMGLRHSGAHCLVEAVSAFVVAFPFAVWTANLSEHAERARAVACLDHANALRERLHAERVATESKTPAMWWP